MHQCKYKWIDKKTGEEKQCRKVILDKFSCCCVHDELFHTGCRYCIKDWHNQGGHREICNRCGHVIVDTINKKDLNSEKIR